MSNYTIFAARKTPRYRRRKVARFMHRLTPSLEMAACVFSLGMCTGVGLCKLLGVI